MTQALTKILHVSYKSGNGRRVAYDFPLTEFQATDVEARANAITNAGSYGFGRGWRLVNWGIKDATPVPK
jgi:hypothetical protein